MDLLKKKNLLRIARVKDSISHVYLERCKIERDNNAICAISQDGKTSFPCATIRMFMFGPGTTVSQAAASVLAENGCDFQFVGEHGVRMYAHAEPLTKSGRNMMKQALLVSNPLYRTLVAKNMYAYRFDERIEKGDSISVLRGKEGARMKAKYLEMSEKYDVAWSGRSYDRKNWENQNPVNKALSSANLALYGICSSVINSLGYSTALGFIHTGNIRSFVFDIGDLYKTEISIPLAFEIASKGLKDPGKQARTGIRDYLKKRDFMNRVIGDLESIFDIRKMCKLHGVELNDPALLNFYARSRKIADSEDELVSPNEFSPSALWDPDKGEIAGGVSYLQQSPIEKEREFLMGEEGMKEFEASNRDYEVYEQKMFGKDEEIDDDDFGDELFLTGLAPLEEQSELEEKSKINYFQEEAYVDFEVIERRRKNRRKKAKKISLSRKISLKKIRDGNEHNSPKNDSSQNENKD
jgi:CRISPR-associated protein Cas1